jgi:hypothetical protein
MQANTIRLTYNEANLLDRVYVNLRGATANGHLQWTPFITNIAYNPKGQRQQIDYGNGASTIYTYDPLTTGHRFCALTTTFPVRRTAAHSRPVAASMPSSVQKSQNAGPSSATMVTCSTPC